MKLSSAYLGHSIVVKFRDKQAEVIFCGWFLEVPLVQMLSEDGLLTGEVHAIEEADIVDLPPLIGEAPAIYCPPHDQ